MKRSGFMKRGTGLIRKKPMAKGESFKRVFTLDQRERCLRCGRRKPDPRKKTCSVRCGRAYQRAMNPNRPRRRCRVCRRRFVGRVSDRTGLKSAFCSLKCASDYRMAECQRQAFSCVKCGALTVPKYARPARSLPRRYCSRACFLADRGGPNNAMYRDGGAVGHDRGPGWRRLSRAIRERDAHCCQRCGRRWRPGERPFAVDHVIPWRVFIDDEKDQANDPKNLATLCPPCHGWKTATAERLWLRGDRLDFAAYECSIRRRSVVESLVDEEAPCPPVPAGTS